MISIKSIFEFSHTLKTLYVEDDEMLRQETVAFFEPFFAKVDTAEDGEKGLEMYNNNHYDLVITDINMPNMNGIEMSNHIREINPDQKILVISAHNESHLLIDLIKSGINSFVLKPIIQEDALNALYSVCRDARALQLNEELFNQLSQKAEELEAKNKKLQAQIDATAVKNNQLEVLLEKNADPVDEKSSGLIDEYFKADEDAFDYDKVCFNSDDVAEIKELMEDAMELTSLYCSDNNMSHLEDTGKVFGKVSSILYLYTPFLDPLAVSMKDLGDTILNNIEAFSAIFGQDQDSVFALFNAIKNDMDNYVNRFAEESMAMKNIHHIHHPTSLSIQQVIGLICPEEIEEGEMEFF